MIQAILSRNIPRKVLLEMEMLGDRWTAAQLESLGVINRVVSHEHLDSTVKDLTDALGKKSPVAMRLGRDSFYRQQDMDFRAAMHYLHGQFLMAELGKPIVGRINGHALAGGLGLACSCDLLVAVDAATFGTPEINVGIWPMMIQAILSRNIPRKVLLEMEMLGNRWTAAQLESLGVINRVVSHEHLDSTVKDLTDALGKKSPVAMRLGRDSFYRQQDMDFRAAMHYLHGQFLLVSQTEDSREGIKAFFEKREPDFKGR